MFHGLWSPKIRGFDMRIGDLIWKQVIELRSRNHISPRDDERLAAIFRWTLPYYYGIRTRNIL